MRLRAAGFACLVAGLAAGAFASEKVVPDADAARRLFVKRCSACHAPDRVYHREASRDEWREVVNRMRRMPQSGISPADAATILDYLAALPGPAAGEVALGGHRAFGRKSWISVLEVRTVNDGAVRVGDTPYTVVRDGLSVTLRHGDVTHALSLRADGKPGRSAILDRWKIGAAGYEIHLILYELRGERVRVGRAIRRRP